MDRKSFFSFFSFAKEIWEKGELTSAVGFCTSESKQTRPTESEQSRNMFDRTLLKNLVRFLWFSFQSFHLHKQFLHLYIALRMILLSKILFCFRQAYSRAAQTISV